jgi:dihydroorotase
VTTGHGPDLEISRAWLVDPATDREGPGEIVVRDGLLAAVTWLSGKDGADVESDGIVVAPGFIDLHTHLREPGNEEAETIASGLAAAAHGGFTTVCAMPNTTPPMDEPGVLALVRTAALASGSPVELLALGAVSVGREGERLAAMGELADAGVVGFSDDGSPVRSASILRSGLAYAGALDLPIVEHAEDGTLTTGAEANDGYVATVLGLRGWPAAAEVSAVARAISILDDVARDVPGARLHLTHLSTKSSIDLVRAAKDRGSRVSCDVTPHHLAMTEEWVAGARRWSWQAVDEAGSARDPWADAVLVDGPYATSVRVNPPLRSGEDAMACLAAIADGTVDAIATDHAPHTDVDKAVEFGWAANGISGLETALGIVLDAVDAGQLTLLRAIEALTTGPARVLGGPSRRGRAVGLVEGAPADLVVFDRADRWTVTAEGLASRGKNTPLLGMDLGGRVLLTMAAGRIAYEARID